MISCQDRVKLQFHSGSLFFYTFVSHLVVCRLFYALQGFRTRKSISTSLSRVFFVRDKNAADTVVAAAFIPKPPFEIIAI